jgi:hypothetical protein
MVILVLICALVFPIIFLISLSPTIQSLIASVAFAFATAAIALIIFTPKMIILLLEGDIEGLNGPSASAGKKGKQLRMSLNFSNRDKNKGTAAAAAAAGAATAVSVIGGASSTPNTNANHHGGNHGTHKAATGTTGNNHHNNTESTTTSPLLDLPYFAPAPADLRSIGNFAQRVQVCRSQAEQWKMLLMRTEQGGLSDNMSSSMNSRNSSEALNIDPHILEAHTAAALTAKPQTHTLGSKIRRSSSSVKSAGPIFVSRNDSEHAVDVYNSLVSNNDDCNNWNYDDPRSHHNPNFLTREVSSFVLTSTRNSIAVEPYSDLANTRGDGERGGESSAKQRGVLQAMELEEEAELNVTSTSASTSTKPTGHSLKATSTTARNT